MENFVKGMAAGLIASIVLGIVMYVRQTMGLPGTDPEQLMTLALYRLGVNITPATGWAAHLLIGTILWGGVFGLFNHGLPGASQLTKGLFFSMVTWLMMAAFLMPLTLAGTNAPVPGGSTIMVTLATHLLFGFILGIAYAAQPRRVGPAQPAWTD